MAVQPGDIALFKRTGPPPELIPSIECLMAFTRHADRSDFVHAALVERVDDDGTVHLLDMGLDGARRWTVASAKRGAFGSDSVTYLVHEDLAGEDRTEIAKALQEIPHGEDNDQQYGFGRLLIKAVVNQGRTPDGEPRPVAQRLANALDEVGGSALCGGFARRTHEELRLEDLRVTYRDPPPWREPLESDAALDDCRAELAALVPTELSAARELLTTMRAGADDATIPAIDALLELIDLATLLSEGRYPTEENPIMTEEDGRRALVDALGGNADGLPPAFRGAASAVLENIDGGVAGIEMFTPGDYGSSPQFTVVEPGD